MHQFQRHQKLPVKIAGEIRFNYTLILIRKFRSLDQRAVVSNRTSVCFSFSATATTRRARSIFIRHRKRNEKGCLFVSKNVLNRDGKKSRKSNARALPHVPLSSLQSNFYGHFQLTIEASYHLWQKPFEDLSIFISLVLHLKYLSSGNLHQGNKDTSYWEILTRTYIRPNTIIHSKLLAYQCESFLP